MLAHFDTLFGYSDNCRRLLRETLLAHSDAFDVPFDTTSQWNTIRLLLAHSVAAEERLVTVRLQEKPLPVRYEDRAATTIEGLFADADAIRAATNAYRRTLTEADYTRPLPGNLPGIVGVLTIGDILFHIINHENYHRGQIVMTLQRNGIDPPNFDFVLLKPGLSVG
jgi:uncharacterized damage-inducible protein DinB